MCAEHRDLRDVSRGSWKDLQSQSNRWTRRFVGPFLELQRRLRVAAALAARRRGECTGRLGLERRVARLAAERGNDRVELERRLVAVRERERQTVDG